MGLIRNKIEELRVINSTISTSVTTAVDGVIDAAPDALNTLNELAAALGDDANYAATVTSQLANKSDVTHNHTGTYEPANSNIQSHISSTTNPHNVSASQVGAYTSGQTDTLLSSKLNTSDFTSTANTWVAGKSTSDLAEGSNLYYLDSRVDAKLASGVGNIVTSGTVDGVDVSTLPGKTIALAIALG